MWNKIKEFIVYNLDTIKIVLTILASIFGVITGCDLKNNWNLQNHPFFDFVKWVLCSHPLLIFLIISVLLITSNRYTHLNLVEKAQQYKIELEKEAIN